MKIKVTPDNGSAIPLALKFLAAQRKSGHPEGHSEGLKFEGKQNITIAIAIEGDIALPIAGQFVGKLSAQKNLGYVHFDFARVDRINSEGVRSLLDLLAAVPKGAQIIYSRCAPAIVEQMNMLSDFLAKGHVASVMVLEYCDSDHEQEPRVLTLGIDLVLFGRLSDAEGFVLLDLDHDYDLRKAGSAPPPKFALRSAACPVCGNGLERNELDSVYFSFLQSPYFKGLA